MDNLSENQNSESAGAALSEVKGVVQDNLNSSKSEEHGHGEDLQNEVLDQNSREKELKESGNSISDGETVAETDVGKESEGEVVKEQSATVNEEHSETDPPETSEQPPPEEKLEKTPKTMEESESAETSSAQNVSEIVDKDVPNGQSVNETTSMDVEESGNSRFEEEMNLDSKEKDGDKVTEDDLENLSQDDASMNPSETNPNPADEETSMNVSEGGDGEQSMEGAEQAMEDEQSMDQEMQDIENVEKDNGETMDVSMANVDVQSTIEESMEVASPSAVDPICLLSSSGGANGPTCEEQMEINEASEDNERPEEEMDDTTRNDEESQDSATSAKQTKNDDDSQDSVKNTEDMDESTKPSEVEGPAEVEGPKEVEEPAKEDEHPEKEVERPAKEDEHPEKENEHPEKEDECPEKEDEHPEKEDERPEKEKPTEQSEDSQKSLESAEEKGSSDGKDDEAAGKVTEDVQDSNAGDTTNESTDTATAEDKDETAKEDKEKQAEASEDQSKDGEISVDPSDVIQVVEDEDAKSDVGVTTILEVEENAEKDVDRPKLTRKSSNAERRVDSPAPMETEHRHQRPQRQAAKRAETQIKELAEEDSNSNEGFEGSGEILEIELTNQMCFQCCRPVSLGKYCVRFGYDIKQFCCSSCLEEFKKGLKVCSYCQKDISSGAEGFLAPVGDKGQFKDFCTQACMEKYDQMSNNQPAPVVTHQCAVCNNEKIVKVEVLLDSKLHKLCSEPCFAAFKFVNKVNADQCDMCKKYFDKMQTEVYSVYYDDAPHSFCCKTCMNVYILANRKIVPCNWCKVKKYNFDMIKRVTGNGQVLMMCSLNCLTLYQVSVNAVSSKRIKCDLCNSVAQAQYHLTMSDATIRNFCSYQCVMSFQGQYSKTTPITFSGSEQTPIPTGGPKRVYPRRSVPLTQNENQMSGNKGPGSMPVISNVTSLATPNGQQVSNNAGITTRSGALKVNNNNIPATPPPPPKTMYKQQVIVKPPPPKVMKNKSVLCKPYMHTKGVSCRPHPCTKETQTDDSIGKKVLIPVPVPIYVPAPMHMYSTPFPVPVPFPLPVPVPIFIPTTRNSAHGIMKEIKKIQEKIPTDPFEAELLMMAEMVAGEKKGENSDSESDDGGNGAGDVSEVPGGSSAAEGGFSPEAVDTSNTFGEDMLQMALKMASELEEPPVDLEAALTPSTITAQSQASMEQNDATESEVDDPEPVQVMPENRVNRGRKRGMRTSRGGGSGPSKRGRRISSSVDIPLLPPPEPQPPPRVEQEKPDANMCLKVMLLRMYTFGVNAWRQWVLAKNAELEKAATNNRKLKLFKPEILQLTADELNYSLCLFVKEVRKPNGSEYAPDTIYYLCLENNARKKKVYEQQENEENPLRCPVKLYEFYLSKCPESVKTRNDVFYLLPERSCVPDSPVWYSTMALGKEPLIKMLHRVKMVKEINIALLTS
ncbi:hypothetical protein C0J52_10012 [Blattella germanica]|nr:hypothetical protein C0J52_10012 [Blattella germanica]